MFKRQLGRSSIEVSAMGLGCWAIGGPTQNPISSGSAHFGWGDVDDDESIRAIHTGLDHGVNFFDTSDMYGAGHSERILGRALARRRDKVVIATKFGFAFDEYTRQMTGVDASGEYIRRACEGSLKRLNPDYIDLYQFHLGDYDPDYADDVCDILEKLVNQGKIRAYAWSTDDPRRARVFAEREHCSAVQFNFNIFEDNAPILELCDEFDLASINRGPLAKGILTGKFSADSSLPANDVRHHWNFKKGPDAERLKQLEALRELLTSDGRTLAQAALGWIWARSDRTIPIPGFKTVEQVQENTRAMEFGPLSGEQIRQIDVILSRTEDQNEA